MGINWYRYIFATAVAGIISTILIVLVKPPFFGFIAGIFAAAWVAHIKGPADGAIVCAVAALPMGLYFGYQAGLNDSLSLDLSRPVILLSAPILGAAVYALLGSVVGGILGLLIRLTRGGRFPFF
jgi:hypothetical protein